MDILTFFFHKILNEGWGEIFDKHHNQLFSLAQNMHHPTNTNIPKNPNINIPTNTNNTFSYWLWLKKCINQPACLLGLILKKNIFASWGMSSKNHWLFNVNMINKLDGHFSLSDKSLSESLMELNDFKRIWTSLFAL